jgi:hypothetical protein
MRQAGRYLPEYRLAERMRYDQNIGKQNCRIESEATDRLQSDFRSPFWIKAEIEKALCLCAVSLL